MMKNLSNPRVSRKLLTTSRPHFVRMYQRDETGYFKPHFEKDEVKLNPVTCQVVLNVLKGNQACVAYSDPVGEFRTLLGEIQRVTDGYRSEGGIPEDLPISIDTDLAQEIYLRVIKDDWRPPKAQPTRAALKKKITTILKRYTGDIPLAKLEMELAVHAPADFIQKLFKTKNPTEMLDEWSSFELEAGDQFFSSAGPDTFLTKYLAQNQTFLLIREAYADKIYGLTEEGAIIPGYEGRYPITKKYITDKLLPWIVKVVNKGKIFSSPSGEKTAYEAFINNIGK